MSRPTQFRILVALTIVWLAWAGWSLIGRATPYELHVLDDEGVPVAAANIDQSGVQQGTSDDEGRVGLQWRSETVLEVSAPGHVTRMVTVSDRPDGVVDVVLTARVLRARVVDPEGQPIEGARLRSGTGEALSDRDGRVVIRGAEPGEVAVDRPAWLPASFTWEGGSGESEVALEPILARAVHITGWAVRDSLEEFLEMTDDTDLNALMIDLKDDDGMVWYLTEDPTAIEVGAAQSGYDLQHVVSRARERDLYVIGRLVLFADPIAAIAQPSMAVWDSELNSPYVANRQYFLDPTDPDARQYGLDLAVESCSLGVDEIQFDYVRFPDSRRESATFKEGVTPEVRRSTIVGFLEEAVELLHPMGCAVAADVFGFVTNAPDDGGIGQNWEEITSVVDVVSPMIYPSHYSSGWYDFENPNSHPGPVVRHALQDGLGRLPRAVVVRPWLQDFGASYGTAEVRAQIEATEEFGLGWMLWHPNSDVTVDALTP